MIASKLNQNVVPPARFACVCLCAGERPTLWTDSMNVVVAATFFQLPTAAGPCDRERHTGC